MRERERNNTSYFFTPRGFILASHGMEDRTTPNQFFPLKIFKRIISNRIGNYEDPGMYPGIVKMVI